MNKQILVGYIFAILATALWSGNFIVARGLNESVPPISLAFYRWLVAIIIFLPFAIKPLLSQIDVIKKNIDEKFVIKATKVWPIKVVDLINPFYETSSNFSIMRMTESIKSKRVMQRGGKDYYEYRDTAMDKNAPFRPEWIREICYVSNNSPKNNKLKWNNGHLLHQFTYFVGKVNFYYMDGKKKRVAIMNTGDTMYIPPYIPHTFASRKIACNGFIIAITFVIYSSFN